MPKFDPTFTLGQAATTISIILSGASVALAFVYGTRADVQLLQYQLAVNERADTSRAATADTFRTEVIVELRAIKEEITRLRIEMQEKEPRKR